MHCPPGVGRAGQSVSAWSGSERAERVAAALFSFASSGRLSVGLGGSEGQASQRAGRDVNV